MAQPLLISIDGDEPFPTTLASFLTDNEFGDDEIADIRARLDEGAMYFGGGGAAPEWVVGHPVIVTAWQSWETPDGLNELYAAFCRREGLPPVPVEDQDRRRLTPVQAAWLGDFQYRRDRAQARAARKAREAARARATAA
ncbi:hypothetical protein [Phenylobacterium sp.]|uniref:hypothetical protein n=1 Tax=Phenylobacterium sp. TaxID=1871053 RepID=UPI0025D35E96|nr:hypothetical protein [Phenylobacterium sp.]MBX3482507.1 hypothetical protein [Phenylobacterium sp.]